MVRNLILILLLWSHAGLGDTLFSYDESTRNRLMRPGIYDISWGLDLQTIRVNDTIDIATPQGAVATYRVKTAKMTNLGNWLITAKAAGQASRLQLIVSPHNSVIGNFEHANRKYQINSDKIFRILGYRPKRSLEDAVFDLCEAFKKGKLPNSLIDDKYVNVKVMKNKDVS